MLIQQREHGSKFLSLFPVIQNSSVIPEAMRMKTILCFLIDVQLDSFQNDSHNQELGWGQRIKSDSK